jgi:hypothetical protein
VIWVSKEVSQCWHLGSGSSSVSGSWECFWKSFLKRRMEAGEKWARRDVVGEEGGV